MNLQEKAGNRPVASVRMASSLSFAAWRQNMEKENGTWDETWWTFYEIGIQLGFSKLNCVSLLDCKTCRNMPVKMEQQWTTLDVHLENEEIDPKTHPKWDGSSGLRDAGKGMPQISIPSTWHKFRNIIPIPIVSPLRDVPIKKMVILGYTSLTTSGLGSIEVSGHALLHDLSMPPRGGCRKFPHHWDHRMGALNIRRMRLHYITLYNSSISLKKSMILCHSLAELQ